MPWCTLGDSRAGGPGTGLLPCPPGWPTLPGLLGGCSLVLPALLSWTVSTTKLSGFLLQYFKAYCFWRCLLVWVKVANFIFYCDECLCWVVEVVWQTRVTEAQMGTSATALALCKCQCWHTGNVCQPGVAFPQRLWCVCHCSSSLLLTLFFSFHIYIFKSPPESPSGNMVTHQWNREGREVWNRGNSLTPAFQILLLEFYFSANPDFLTESPGQKGLLVPLHIFNISIAK